MQPVEQTRIGIVGLVFMGVALQGWDIAHVTITVNRTALGKRGLGKPFDRGPLDILCDLHLGIAGLPPLIQGYSRKNLRLFRTSAPFLAGSWPAEIRIVKFNGPVELVCLVLLTHNGTDTHEHIPCGFIGSSKHRHQRNGGDASFVLTDKVECQKPLRQRHMDPVKHCPRRHRGLMVTPGALIPAIGQQASVTAIAFRADKPVRPPQFFQVFPAFRVGGKLFHKCPQWIPLFLRHDPFPFFSF